MATTDLIVVLPGIMGSTLARNGDPVWAPSPGALLGAVRTMGRSVKDLELPEGVKDGRPDDGVEPVGLVASLHSLPGIWAPVKGYDVLIKWLKGLGYREALTGPEGRPGNLLPVPYDWRLSNRYNGRRLAGIVEPALDRWRAQGGQYADARVVFICHSMGGLVARWYIECEGGAEITRKLITLGTPYRGAAKALVQLVNAVPLRLGPIAISLTDLMRSLPALHQLLPEYACITSGAELVRTTETQLPGLSTAMVTDAMAFHTRLREAEQARQPSGEMTHAIVGTRQPTPTTVTLSGGEAIALDTYRTDNLYGDATVPMTGAVRADVKLDSPVLRRVADKHGNLHRNRAAFDEIEGILTGQDIVVKDQDSLEPQVAVPELLIVGDDVVVDINLPANHGVQVTVRDEYGHVVDSRVPKMSRGHAQAVVTGLPPGGYTVDVTGISVGAPVAPISSGLIIWDPTTA